jgi:predicted nucleic acid-binding protein
MSRDNNSCYLDADFLVAVFVPNHKYFLKSTQLFADLLAEKKMLFLSCLTLDEVWYKVWVTLQEQVPKEKRKPIKDFHKRLKGILESIQANPMMKVIQFENDLAGGCVNALENIRNYNLQPRDAFHYAYMQDSQINCIVTHDDHFVKLSKKAPSLVVRTI